MTVADAIEALKLLPPDALLVAASYEGGYHPVETVAARAAVEVEPTLYTGPIEIYDPEVSGDRTVEEWRRGRSERGRFRRARADIVVIE